MIRTAMVGLGKMGLSHLAIFRAHPDIDLVAGCDSSTYLTQVLEKHTGLKCYSDLDELLAKERVEALIVSTPSRLHAGMVEKALTKGMHVFCEKPFVLDVDDGERLVALADERRLVTQVGYHFRFVGAFRELARVVRSGALGHVHHVRAEAYGPVVLRPKGGTWRMSKEEGGGALYDYACHAIDLTNFVFGTPIGVSGVARRGVFSRDVDDEVYATLHFPEGISGQLCVNWSDESYRKMYTRITVWGTNGRASSDRQECQIYLRDAHPALPDTPAGWTVRNTTELTEEVWYYLRGEEYSAQADYWAKSIQTGRLDGENSFRSALKTDKVVSMIMADAQRVGADASTTGPASWQPKHRGFFARLFG